MKELQSKYEKEMPEREELIKENERLRKQFEDYVASTNTLKEDLENQMKLKADQTSAFEDKFKGEIKTQIEDLVSFYLLIIVY